MKFNPEQKSSLNITKEEVTPELAFCKELQEISGRFGLFEDIKRGYFFSNDTGVADVYPAILEYCNKNRQNDVSVFIGPGGLLSLLPDLNTKTVISMDINYMELRFNKFLVELIKRSNSGREVMDFLLSGSYTEKFSCNPFQVLNDIHNYSTYHWSNEDKFIKLKNMLSKTKIVYIAADMKSERLSVELSRVFKKYNREITFANFTNVHQWIRRGSNWNMDFLQRWPISKTRCGVLFSDHEGHLVGDFPGMHFVNSLDQYIKQANSSESL